MKIGEPIKVSFFRQVAPGATLIYEDILYACDDDVCPEYTKDPRKCDYASPADSLSVHVMYSPVYVDCIMANSSFSQASKKS